jgi:2-methylcitrate dehydratase PrpD
MMNDMSNLASQPEQHILPTAGLSVFLGEQVAAMRYEMLPAQAVHWARVGILDTVGVTLAGALEPCTQILAQALGSSSGNAVVFGTSVRCHPLDAALLNGTASHALDFDDCNNTLGGHPSVPILPALFALSDEVGATGRDLVTAYVAGFEVETKIAMSVHFHHYTKGWHPTSTLGVFGAAAACARLLQLDAQQTAVALALAASSSAGLKANFGTMTKPMHIGRCAREGLLAAKLAQAGYTANSLDVFEHPQGFFEVYNGKGNYDPDRGRLAWASPLDIVAPGIAIKQYPCCGSTHPAIDCAIELYQTQSFTLKDIARVDIWIHSRRLQHTNRPQPRTGLDAKFSVQYVVSRALIDGFVSLEHFEGRAFEDAQVTGLLPHVFAQPYDDSQFDPSNHFGGEVRVTLKSGQILTAKVQQPLGRTSANPLPEERLKTKFELCAARVINAQATAQAYDAILRIESIEDVRTITALLGA